MTPRNLPVMAQLIQRPFFASDVKWGIERRNFIHETTKIKYEPEAKAARQSMAVWARGEPVARLRASQALLQWRTVRSAGVLRFHRPVKAAEIMKMR